MKLCTICFVAALAVVAAMYFGIGHESQFIFDPMVLNEVAQKAIREHPGDVEAMIPLITAELSARYPGHILPKAEWLFNNAGGSMGAMTILHASLTEYVIIFGTPIGTEGHTGRFFADDFFYILDGEQTSFSAGDLKRESYTPGDMHHLPRGQAQAYRMPENCWALEYARGNIPSMLPFGVFDTLFSTLDFVTLYQTFAIYTRAVVHELFTMQKI